MTVIAWDGRTLAADKRACNGTMIATVTKIRRAPDGSLIGSAGNSDAGEEVMAWYERGADPKEFSDNMRNRDDFAGLLVIRPDGEVWKFERTPYPIRFSTPFAIGSGREFAMAAMYLGHDARKAVEVACALDCGCGNGVDQLGLK